jgi:pyridinium-3,5-biscarboxylic acid mononucleotide sulfurtransferase
VSEQLAADLREKFSALTALLCTYQKAILAFSGGVDSSFLLKAMKVAGMEIMAVTAVSETTPGADALNAVSLAEEIGVSHRIIRTEEMLNESFVSNPPDRCFHCKDELFKKLKIMAAENGLRFIFDGSNADDERDYRPGRRAAEMHGVRSPLAECRFSKNEIRKMSREFGLSTWNKPSSPCLSSRFPYGRRITQEALIRVAKAEEFIRNLGFRTIRVRDCGDTARIEVREEDMHMLIDRENRLLVASTLKSLGYHFISVDLEGYRNGSLNRALEDRVAGLSFSKGESG